MAMTLFSKHRAGISIQEGIIVVSEMIMPSHQPKKIEKISAMKMTGHPVENGRLIDKPLLQQNIRQAFQKASPNPIRSKEIVFEIPDEITFQKIVSLPLGLEEKDLEESIIAQVEKILPYPRDQISWDYSILKTEAGKQKVLFTAAPLEVIREYYDAFIQMGLTPMGFSIRAENIQRSLLRNESGKTMVVDMQKKSSSLLEFEGTALVRQHQLNLGEDHFKKAISSHFNISKEDLIKQLPKIAAVDVNLATLALMKELETAVRGMIPNQLKRKTTSLIIIANSIYAYPLKLYWKEQKDGWKRIETNLKEIIVIPIESKSLLEIFNLKKKSSSSNTELSSHRVQYEKGVIRRLLPSALGSSVADFTHPENGKLITNLLPPMVRSMAVWKETNPWFALTATILLLFSVGWLMTFGFVWGSTTAQLRVSKENLIMLQRQFEIKKPMSREERIEEANKELKILAAFQKNPHPKAEVLQTIQQLLPQETKLISLQFGLLMNKSLFELKGTAVSREKVIETYTQLKTVPFIQEVFFPASNLDAKKDISFTIRFLIKPTDETLSNNP